MFRLNRPRKGPTPDSTISSPQLRVLLSLLDAFRWKKVARVCSILAGVCSLATNSRKEVGTSARTRGESNGECV